MADKEHLKILRQGISAWNEWRRESPEVRPDLSRVDFSNADLTDTNFTAANLNESYLNGALLSGSSLCAAALCGASFFGANLQYANLSNANLSRVNLKGASLVSTDFNRALVANADFEGAALASTKFIDVDLSQANNLDTCWHMDSSFVDHLTIMKSRNVPLSFWRGCGLPDQLVDYMPSLASDAFQYYSCFISYSSTDQEFANRIYADMQSAFVRCWFAPHDLPIGAKTWDGIDEAIRTALVHGSKEP